MNDQKEKEIKEPRFYFSKFTIIAMGLSFLLRACYQNHVENNPPINLNMYQQIPR